MIIINENLKQMKANKVLKGLCILSIVLSMSSAICSQTPKSRPEKDGFVPNAETAIRIAEAVWLPIYGEKLIGHKLNAGGVRCGSARNSTTTRPATPVAGREGCLLHHFRHPPSNRCRASEPGSAGARGWRCASVS